MGRVVARNVWKTYDDHVVLENLNLEVEEREFVTIVGASGCGKTTFLRMLLGVDRPSRGSLLIDGKPAPTEPGADRGIVFQRYSLFPHLTVMQNLMLGVELQESRVLGRLFGSRRRAAVLRAETLLETVGLSSARDKYPAQLSGGMQQRLSIAQSVIRRPRILLLDEPFGALDPGLTGDMHKLVRELWATHDMTIFMITHDLQEGFALGTRLLVFDKVRHDPQAPDAYGSRVTYDIKLNRSLNAAVVHPSVTSSPAAPPAK